MRLRRNRQDLHLTLAGVLEATSRDSKESDACGSEKKKKGNAEEKQKGGSLAPISMTCEGHGGGTYRIPFEEVAEITRNRYKAARVALTQAQASKTTVRFEDKPLNAVPRAEARAADGNDFWENFKLVIGSGVAEM